MPDEALSDQRVLLDTNAVLAILRGTKQAQQVIGLIRGARIAAICTPIIAELHDVLIRSHGQDPNEAAELVSSFAVDASLTIIPLKEDLAKQAGTLRAKHYVKAAQPLSMADCVLLAIASQGYMLVSSDRILCATAQAEGVKVAELNV